MPCNLTQKDLSVIEDQLMHLGMGCRAAAQYANALNTPSLKNMAITVSQHQRERYDALLNFLNGCN